MTRWDQIALGVFVLGGLWFAWPAPKLAGDLQQSRADALRGATVEDLVQGVVNAPDDALPAGVAAEQAAALLAEGVELYGLQLDWGERVAAVLTPEQMSLLAGVERGSSMPRARSHPETPAEMLEILEHVVAQHGPTRSALPDPVSEPDATAEGLLVVVQAGVTADQAPAIVATTLAGVHAHERGAAVITELEVVLAESLSYADGRAFADRDAFDRMAAQAVTTLRER
ncbi:MAG: hypothetical protein GY913_01880 [Proteobacteria bacterium]|nr:hypothetical protein [Pseudomonadota bacterium]MCP4915650.1 hypothetical protein [Pseudomonadota bacterium]